MTLFFYTIFLKIYPVGIRIASLWNSKAMLWLNGRKKFPVMELPNGEKETIWMHCASLGEFE
ncbi:MAG: 3-deoxy-D-manno-octulosonic acid transferase, partial [Chitinophagaceae bacterium]